MYLALCRLVPCFVVIVYSVCDGQMSYILPDWSLSGHSLVLYYIDTYTTNIHIYIYIYSIGCWLCSVCKCNCNCSCSLWIMKDESTRLDSRWTVSLLEPICTELDSCFPYSIFHLHPYIRRQSVSMRSLLLSIINHITEIPKQSEGYN